MARGGKVLAFFGLMALAVLAAGLFGAVHNQLSYTVGPAYFTEIKFAQFAIPPELQNRFGASLVGWRASWWMGLFIGLPAFLIGLFIVPRARSYVAAGIGAIGLVILFTALAALLGLVLGLTMADSDRVAQVIPPSWAGRPDLIRAGLMHDASYLGGALGAVLAIWPMIAARKRDMAVMAAEGA